MKYLTLILLIISVSCYSQDSSFNNKKCDFITDGTGKSQGLKIKLKTPCEWDSEEGDMPNYVKNFYYTFSDGSSMSNGLIITKLAKPLTLSGEKELLTPNSFKKIVASKKGTYITARNIQIDGVSAIEVIFKSNSEISIGHTYVYNIEYYFFCKKLLVSIGYSLASTNESRSKELFDKYKNLFRTLVNMTSILSNYE